MKKTFLTLVSVSLLIFSCSRKSQNFVSKGDAQDAYSVFASAESEIQESNSSTQSDAEPKFAALNSSTNSLESTGKVNKLKMLNEFRKEYKKLSKEEKNEIQKVASKAKGKGGDRATFTISSFVLGICAIVFIWFPIVNFILAILATVFGVIASVNAFKNDKKLKGLALAGAIMGALAFLLIALL